MVWEKKIPGTVPIPPLIVRMKSQCEKRKVLIKQLQNVERRITPNGPVIFSYLLLCLTQLNTKVIILSVNFRATDTHFIEKLCYFGHAKHTKNSHRWWLKEAFFFLWVVPPMSCIIFNHNNRRKLLELDLAPIQNSMQSVLRKWIVQRICSISSDPVVQL